MKKLISIALVLVLLLSLCACGNVAIGPLTFHFGERAPIEAPPNMASGNAAIEAPPAEEPMYPAEEAPMEAYGDFEFTVHTAFYGDFAENGVPASWYSEGAAPYLLVSFTFRDTYGIYGDVVIEGVDIGGYLYPPVDPYANEQHFVNNIDRYFGYEYAYDKTELSDGELKGFACFELDEKAYEMFANGWETYIMLCGTQIPIYPESTELIDDIFHGEAYYGYTYEGAHSGATLLWSLDLSRFLLDNICMQAEMCGDTGHFEDYSYSEHLSFVYNSGTYFSPAVTPILQTGFSYGYAPVPFEIGFAYEKYPDIADIAYDYAEICMRVCELSYSPGNYEEMMSLINTAYELYMIMASILSEGYGIELMYY